MASIFTNWCTTQGTNITVYDFRAEVLRSPTAHPHNLQDAGGQDEPAEPAVATDKGHDDPLSLTTAKTVGDAPRGASR
jgi:hypothetical protein